MNEKMCVVTEVAKLDRKLKALLEERDKCSREIREVRCALEEARKLAAMPRMVQESFPWGAP